MTKNIINSAIAKPIKHLLIIIFVPWVKRFLRKEIRIEHWLILFTLNVPIPVLSKCVLFFCPLVLVFFPPLYLCLGSELAFTVEHVTPGLSPGLNPDATTTWLTYSAGPKSSNAHISSFFLTSPPCQKEGYLQPEGQSTSTKKFLKFFSKNFDSLSTAWICLKNTAKEFTTKRVANKKCFNNISTHCSRLLKLQLWVHAVLTTVFHFVTGLEFK